jgi:hypothetical protein
MTDNKDSTRGPWPKGMNNVAPDYALPEGTARSIVNADILDNGSMRRRNGFTALFETSNIRGATSVDLFGIAYVEGDTLKLRDNSGNVSTLRTGLYPAQMTFYSHNGEVFFSNGTDSGKIVGGAAKEWGVEAANTPPTIATGSGGVPAGMYQALCTFENATGEEGGCNAPSVIVLNAAASMTLTPPAATSAEVVLTNFYMTPPNGDVFYYVGSTTGGAALTLSTEPGYGPALKTQFLQKMPAGTHITNYKGRMYVALDNVLWYSEPYTFGLCRLSSNFIMFPEDVTLLADMEDGLYVASDRVYFHAGTGPENFTQSVALDCSVASGSPGASNSTADVIAFTDRGMAVLRDGGEVEVLDKHVRADPADSAALLIREYDSMRQYVGVSRLSANSSGLTATDYMDAEIIRRSE